MHLRLGSLIAAVTLWFVGIRMESDLLRIAAMAVVVVALAIGVATRKEGTGTEEDADEGPDSGGVAQHP